MDLEYEAAAAYCSAALPLPFGVNLFAFSLCMILLGSKHI